MRGISLFKFINIYFDGIATGKCLLISLLCAFLLGVLDYITGAELSFSVFYIIPIMLATWYGGRFAGLTIMVISASIWLGVDLATGSGYSTLFVPLWNTLVRLTFFLIILQLLLALQRKLKLEENFADTDALTGLANRRFFQEQLDREYARVLRYPEPFTIAYFDLDNFKQVNDTMGHNVGDELLKAVSETLSASIRRSDYAARLGGDEFAVLFPSLEKESAVSALAALRNDLLLAMQKSDWLVTFSIGVVTFSKTMDSSRDMIKKVDDVMYEVKKSGKNNIRHVVWPE